MSNNLVAIELPRNVETAKRDIADLVKMHTYCRPNGSDEEKEFIARFIEPLGVDKDGAGNLIAQIGDAPVVWSCHTDTVHAYGGRQTVHVATVTTPAKDGSDAYTDRFMWLSKKALGCKVSCLGADDTAGVWLMRELILAEKPGLYIFHRGEECGAVGSRYIASKTPALLTGMNMAIALDRAGYADVITQQFGSRTASDGFAKSIAQQLGMGFKPCPNGVFTDTAEYAELIPECTNLSVGYFNQHTDRECLNLDFILDLRDRLLALDTDSLVVERDPAQWHDGQRDTWTSKYWDYSKGDDVQRTLGDIVSDYPDEVADWLEHLGHTAQEVLEAIYERGGHLY